MRRLLLWAWLCVCTSSLARADSFADLRAAYLNRDAAAAAAVYAADAVVTYRYDGAPEERYAGRAAIAKSFRALFDQIDPAQRVDLNFRATSRAGGAIAGLYRLRIGRSASYGRFAVTVSPDGKFASDLSTSATVTDFEEAPGPVMFAADDETLERSYYARMAGRYRLADGCELVVTRSLVRLFVRDTCTNQWRGLNRVSGREWTAGDRVLSDKRTATYRFAGVGTGASPSLTMVNGAAGRVAMRRDLYRVEEVVFASADGTRLTGSIYVPLGAKGRRPATALIHGSGAQDRDGYASIIAVLADQLAANGRVVLAYDKRGSGGSGGDGDRAGFDTLAADAMAGMTALAARREVDAAKIGLAGSSQAGWVAARAIARGARPADILLLGAAGAALTVAEQNLYNTGVRMRCAGIAADDVQLALDQQRAFFAYLKNPGRAGALDALTERARARPVLADWLFPDSRATDRSAGSWYVVLDPGFDPLPVWRSYRGRALFLFGEHDDATPTAAAMLRLSGTAVSKRLLPAAQHLGLQARDVCHGELRELNAFSPLLMSEIARFGSPAKARR